MKKQLHSLFSILFLLFSLVFSYGQSVKASNEVISGFSEIRLDRYSKFLNTEITEGRIPGAVSYIYRKGEIVHKAALGYSSWEAKTPMKHDNIFHIMSMTKPIISVAFLMLYEEGHFFLTDPVSKYLPQFKDFKVSLDVNKGIDGATEPAKSEITIHQLLTHTAGFTHGIGGTTLDNEIAQAIYFEPQSSIESRVNTLIGLPLIGHPGGQWHYSASPDVLSLLIEYFSGMTTAEFLQIRIFDPLEMKDTGYNIPTNDQDRWVPVHNINEEGKLVNSDQQLPIEGNMVYGGTHGLFSTADDYMKFCQMMLNGGKGNGKRLLSPKTIEIMTMNQVGDLYNGQGFGLGFGITTDVAKSKALGSKGVYYWSGAYSTYFFIDPKEDLIAILMTQVQPYSNYYGTKFPQYIYQALVD
ncbi:MAG: serine hydrolase domain-containing protein [Eudoraea sp.]|uniref:serine hydrolase domain-containing protein n=1 Tax=Eudoraea sp. TaxID=1979955 RepID=UPI003C73D616